jgi:hypothetical protein
VSVSGKTTKVQCLIENLIHIVSSWTPTPLLAEFGKY